jgi:hypothetical protein
MWVFAGQVEFGQHAFEPVNQFGMALKPRIGAALVNKGFDLVHGLLSLGNGRWLHNEPMVLCCAYVAAPPIRKARVGLSPVMVVSRRALFRVLLGRFLLADEQSASGSANELGLAAGGPNLFDHKVEHAVPRSEIAQIWASVLVESSHHSASRARIIAGLSGFFTLSQSRDRPDR